MKALVLHGHRSLTVLSADRPVPREEEVLLAVTACAVCRTDGTMWARGHRDLSLPRILGHEIVGITEESNERFAVWPGIACGTCFACRRGAENLCPGMQIIGFHRDGGFAEYIAVPRASLIPVPPGLSDHIACLAEPTASVLNALEQIQVAETETLLIIGGGPVGLLAAAAAIDRGAVPHVIEPNREKSEKGAAFRDMMGIAVSHDIPADRRFDKVLNATSSVDAFFRSVGALNDGGEYCLFSGLVPGDSQIPSLSTINEFHYRQLTLTGAYGNTRRQMEDAMTLLSRLGNSPGMLIEDILNITDLPRIIPLVAAGKAMKYIITMKET